MEEGLANSLIENLNQRTYVLMEEEISEKHTEMLPKNKEALRPYAFYFNDFFVSTSFISDAGGNSTQVKEKEEFSVEICNPWNREIRLPENQDSRHEEESQFQYWEMNNVKVQDNSKQEGKYERAVVKSQ